MGQDDHESVLQARYEGYESVVQRESCDRCEETLMRAVHGFMSAHITLYKKDWLFVVSPFARGFAAISARATQTAKGQSR